MEKTLWALIDQPQTEDPRENLRRIAASLKTACPSARCFAGLLIFQRTVPGGASDYVLLVHDPDSGYFLVNPTASRGIIPEETTGLQPFVARLNGHCSIEAFASDNQRYLCGPLEEISDPNQPILGLMPGASLKARSPKSLSGSETFVLAPALPPIRQGLGPL